VQVNLQRSVIENTTLLVRIFFFFKLSVVRILSSMRTQAKTLHLFLVCLPNLVVSTSHIGSTKLNPISFGMFYCKVCHLQQSVLMVKDCSAASGFCGLQSIVYMAKVFIGVFFLCRCFIIIFNLWQAMDDHRKKLTVLVFVLNF